MSNIIFKKETHEYFKDNKKLVSVSTILNNYFGNSYENVPKEILDYAKIRGNTVHKILELYFKNIDNPNIYDKLKLIINKKFKNTLLNYCITALDFIDDEFNGGDGLFTVEKPISYDIIAGTPDLITCFDDYFGLGLVEYKTYKNMTKELRLKTELQLTAYYWIAKNLGWKINNNAEIYWFKEKSVEIIKVNITEAKIHEWEMAIALWKENSNE